MSSASNFTAFLPMIALICMICRGPSNCFRSDHLYVGLLRPDRFHVVGLTESIYEVSVLAMLRHGKAPSCNLVWFKFVRKK